MNNAIVSHVRIGNWIYGASERPDRRWEGWVRMARDGALWERDTGMLGSLESVRRRHAALALESSGEEVVWLDPEVERERDDIVRLREEGERERAEQALKEAEKFEDYSKAIAEIEDAGRKLRGKRMMVGLRVGETAPRVEVKATVFGGVLAVHKGLGGESGWVITETAGGLAVIRGIVTDSRARGIVARLMPIWTPEPLKNEALRAEVRRILENWLHQ